MDDARRASRVQQFFAGITEYTFHARLGVVDPPLVDYISALLTRFIHNDAIYTVRSPTGKRLIEVAEMLNEAQQRVGMARRELHRHIGDYTLFWAGLYPESLDSAKASKEKDALLDYRIEGKRAYKIASEIPTDNEQAPAEVLGRLSDQYDLCAYGLSEVRRQWEDREDEGDGLIA
ncbi:MAG: hypothetical protein MI757_14280 [Pirellulales bacterium]|nr:hypothetical protein [Pirellulales bacterium]